MTNIRIEPLHSELGARITGVDLTRDLDDATVETLREAVDTYSFVLFPGQRMDDAAQLALTRRFGEPEPSHVAKGEGKLEYFGTIGNVQPDGTVLGNTHKKTIFLTGNNMWHSDASFKDTPAFLSIMCAYETPAEGGATLFASTRRTYERMSPERKAELDPLIVIHDYVYSRSKVAPDAVFKSALSSGQSETASEPSSMASVSRLGLATEPESRWSRPMTTGAVSSPRRTISLKASPNRWRWPRPTQQIRAGSPWNWIRARAMSSHVCRWASSGISSLTLASVR